MTALQYLDSLIEGQKLSSLPIAISELEFLKKLLVAEAQGKSLFSKEPTNG